jgi:hypothetical protein
LKVDPDQKFVIFDIDRKILENAPGFDKDEWPQFRTREWLANLYLYYKYPRYW